MKNLLLYIINFCLVFVIVLLTANVFDIDWQAALISFGLGVLYTLIVSIMYGANNEN